jgi:hypothetical protein
MAKANLTLADGTKVDIEGTAEEVAALLAKFSTPSELQSGHRRKVHRKRSERSRSGNQRPKRKGPKILIEDLAQEGYFKSKRALGEIQKKLEEKGHIYDQHSLSTPLLRLTRNKTLRRIKEKNGWVYVS